MTQTPSLHIATVIQERQLRVKGVLGTEQICEGAKFHSPRPLLVNRYTQYEGGLRLVQDPNRTPAWWLCGSCSSNADLLLTLLITFNGSVSWEIRREFGNAIRQIAEVAYADRSQGQLF